MSSSLAWDPEPDQLEPSTHRWLTGDDSGETGLIARLRPAEGWLAIPLVLLLCATLAWSIADSRWILGDDRLTSWLLWVAPLAALWGYLSSRLAISRWVAHVLGACLATAVLTVTVGYVVDPTAPNMWAAFQATANSVTEAYLDLTWRHHLTTTQFGHFCMVLGVLVWGTAQAASYDVFGHKRAVNGVLLLGVALVANMSLTIRDQFGALVIFSAAALALLLRSHAADERMTWMRHRIWRPRDSGSAHLAGGTAFATTAIVASLVLTTVASSAPLANAWPGMNDTLRDFATWFGRYLPPSGGGRISTGGDFADSTQINSVWVSQNDPEFQVRAPEDTAFHWRMVAYDKFGSTGWEVSKTLTRNVNGAARLEAGTLDALPDDAPGRMPVQVTVTLQDTSIRRLIAPNEPISVNVPTQLTVIGTTADLRAAFATTDATSYDVSALVPNIDPLGKGLTANQLRASGHSYPADVSKLYLQGTDFVGKDGKDLLQEILKSGYYKDHALDNPYDIARAIEAYLRADPGEHPNAFTYNEDISSIAAQCTGLSTVDCFARYRQGFCQQYATTMTMLLRMEGIPARYVQGYLPGTLDQNTRVRQVTRRDQHAWVEAYFPGYGWIEFDPTGGGHGQVTPLPAGAAVTPRPTFSAGPVDSGEPGATRTRPDAGGAGTTTPTDSGGTIAVLVFGGLIAAAFVLFVLLLLRRPPKVEAPDTVYRSVVRLASWLGYRPLPTQTVYEYTGMLGTVLPGARPQLEQVASAKVEVTYAKRELARERLEMLARARARLRWALMRLAFRRPRRRRRLK